MRKKKLDKSDREQAGDKIKLHTVKGAIPNTK